MGNPKTVIVVGTRPNIVKLAAIQRAAKKHNYEYVLLHTGQHYTDTLNSLLMTQLGITTPKFQLTVDNGPYHKVCGRYVNTMYKIFSENKFDTLIAIGDVDSSYFAALAAARCNMRVLHVEAGLRANDRSLPEELNRVAIDALSCKFFVTEYSGVRNLVAEGYNERDIYLVGNTMIDTLLATKSTWEARKLYEELKLNRYVLATIHRKSNTDNVDNACQVMSIINKVADHIPVALPLHPRTKAVIDNNEIYLHKNIVVTPPLGYIEFMSLASNCVGIITDSGGVQEEAAFLKKSCATLRDSTERPITIESGSNKLFPINASTVEEVLSHIYTATVSDISTWDGNAANRIIETIK